MRVEVVDLSRFTDQVSEKYQRLSKTQIRLLSSQVPESFIEKFKDEETALLELLDTIYGTFDNDNDL